jgi:hypothetical protein
MRAKLALAVVVLLLAPLMTDLQARITRYLVVFRPSSMTPWRLHMVTRHLSWAKRDAKRLRSLGFQAHINTFVTRTMVASAQPTWWRSRHVHHGHRRPHRTAVATRHVRRSHLTAHYHHGHSQHTRSVASRPHSVHKPVVGYKPVYGYKPGYTVQYHPTIPRYYGISGYWPRPTYGGVRRRY